ncbi:MAG: hypothetical protein KDE31_32270, partial [Caldilineaceae bacterium]|nr:hypothetical protein [Caldilineaceae bacterium]
LLGATATQQGRYGDLIQIECLCALAHQAANEVEQAGRKLADALTRAAPEGYIRTFIDFGEPLALLRNRSEWPAELTPYVNTLLAAFSSATTVSPATAVQAMPAFAARTNPSPATDLLSERELEIMHLIADGLTASQMAEKLIISVHTMRTHLKNIYRKLEVNSRVQAVEKVRTLGLL